MPEGGELQLQLAGLGSRFIAGSADLIIQLLVVVVLVLVTGALSGGRRLDQVIFVIGVFLVWFGYPIAFEVLARGRTPGNLIRLFDGPTLLYVPTVVSILATRRNQRPGDIAAGTLVVRDAPTRGRHAPVAAMTTRHPWGSVDELDWDASAVSPDEVAALRRFLDRRETLEPAARIALGNRLAEAMAEKVVGAQREMTAEQFLEVLVELKGSRQS
jgi:uncharacterized RDD family membrane protein YckC